METGNIRNANLLSLMACYKRVVAIPLLDSLISQLKDMFTCDNKDGICVLLTLISSVLSLGNQQSAPEERFSLWLEEIPAPKSLLGELERWRRLWSRDKSVATDSSVPSNFVESLTACVLIHFRIFTTYYLLVVLCLLQVLKLREHSHY